MSALLFEITSLAVSVFVVTVLEHEGDERVQRCGDIRVLRVEVGVGCPADDRTLYSNASRTDGLEEAGPDDVECGDQVDKLSGFVSGHGLRVDGSADHRVGVDLVPRPALRPRTPVPGRGRKARRVDVRRRRRSAGLPHLLQLAQGRQFTASSVLAGQNRGSTA
jgi:hypothetical protein